MTATVKRKPNRYSVPATNGSAAYALNYDGSAVRQPGYGGAEVLRPRPKVRTREKAITRPVARVREAGHISLFAIVGFLAVGVFASLLLMSYVQLTVASDHVSNLNSELSALKSEQKKLLAKYELAYDLSGIEAQVTADGSMVKPEAGQIYTIDLSEPDSVVHYDQISKADATVNGIFDEAKHVFTSILEYFR
ncbi:MAG: hypothetical protein EOM52_06625 [Clostridia bacterium]|nr:hypothetical protein [Clostridia bacterium]